MVLTPAWLRIQLLRSTPSAGSTLRLLGTPQSLLRPPLPPPAGARPMLSSQRG
jgi:hypothetical protein